MLPLPWFRRVLLYAALFCVFCAIFAAPVLRERRELELARRMHPLNQPSSLLLPPLNVPFFTAIACAHFDFAHTDGQAGACKLQDYVSEQILLVHGQKRLPARLHPLVRGDRPLVSSLLWCCRQALACLPRQSDLGALDVADLVILHRGRTRPCAASMTRTCSHTSSSARASCGGSGFPNRRHAPCSGREKR